MPFLTESVEVTKDKVDSDSDFNEVVVPQTTLPFESVAVIVEYKGMLKSGNSKEFSVLSFRGDDTGHVYVGYRSNRRDHDFEFGGTLFIPLVDGPVIGSVKSKAFEYNVDGAGFDGGLDINIIGYVGACLETTGESE